MKIHPTAIIDPTIILPDDIQIGPYVIIGPDVKFGARCRVLSHAVIEFTHMGDDCVVYPQAALGLPPQHLGYKNEPTRVEIGSRCVFREGVTIHRGTIMDKGVTRIGNDGYFMAYSHVAHDCIVGDHVIMANGALLGGHAQIQDRVFVSGTVAVHQHVRVGCMAILSGGSMVSTDVPPYSMVQGDRAHLVGLNLVGLKRGGVDRDSVRLIRKAYHVVFYSRLTLDKALQQPELNVDNKFVRKLKEFLSTPKRGFVRPIRKEGGTVEENE